MNADRTIYGRFGSRSDQKNAERDISIDGFRHALAGALDLHRNYPQNKQLLRASSPNRWRLNPRNSIRTWRAAQADLDYEGAVVRSCLHCHQVREAERTLYRAQRKPIPDEVLLPYPMPDAVGFSIDPKSKARVSAVSAGGAAEKAGFAANDEISRSTASRYFRPRTSSGSFSILLRRAALRPRCSAELNERISSWNCRPVAAEQ